MSFLHHPGVFLWMYSSTFQFIVLRIKHTIAHSSAALQQVNICCCVSQKLCSRFWRSPWGCCSFALGWGFNRAHPQSIRRPGRDQAKNTIRSQVTITPFYFSCRPFLLLGFVHLELQWVYHNPAGWDDPEKVVICICADWTVGVFMVLLINFGDVVIVLV